MTIYTKCAICGSEKSANKVKYCGKECQKIGIERSKTIFEQKDIVVNDIAKMCPVFYDEATTRISEKFDINKRKVGSYFRRIILATFRIYPTTLRGGNQFVLYLPGQEEEARQMFRTYIEAIDDKEIYIMRKMAKRRKEVTPIVLEMWARGEALSHICKRVKMTEKTVKSIIAEKGRDYIG